MKQRTPSVVNSATTKSPSVIAKSGVTPGACHPIPTQAHVSNSNCIYKEKISLIEGYIKKKKIKQTSNVELSADILHVT